MKLETNHILYACRLPIHFWNEVQGVPDFRDNPGYWLMSYVVAKSLLQEYTTLPPELRPAFTECETFSENYSELSEWLGKHLKGTVEGMREDHPLYPKLSALAVNFFAGMALNDLPRKRELLINTKQEFDRLRDDLVKYPPKPPKPDVA